MNGIIIRTEHEESVSFPRDLTVLIFVDFDENTVPHSAPPLHE